jgi:hypothetical protein
VISMKAVKGKAFPVQAWRGPEGSRQEVETPRISRHSAHEGGKVVRSTRRLPVKNRQHSCYSNVFEAESIPGS